MKIANTSKAMLKKDEIEKRILERFPNLKDNQEYHNMFCSYDFHENEINLLEFWKDVIEFIYENIKDSHGIKFEEIFDYTKIKGKKPLGLNNIMQKLIEDGDIIPSSLLTNEDYLKKYFHEHISIKETWGKWLKKSFSNYFWKEKQYIPKNNEVLLNKKLFINYNNAILNIFEEFSNDEDCDVLTYTDFKNLIRKNDFEETYLEHSLTFLEKINKIVKFTVKLDGNDVLCVKFLKNDKSGISEKDSAVVNLSLSIKKTDKMIAELLHKIEELKTNAKKALCKNDKQQASNFLKKKIIYQRSHDYYFNVKLSLEQNLLDIKSMESNKNIHNVLMEAAKATKALKINIDDFDNVAEKVRENVENMKEVHDIIGDVNGDLMNNDELDKELMELQISEEKANRDRPIIIHQEQEKNQSREEIMGISRLFPSVNSNKNILNKELNKNDLVIIKEENKENFINDNSFQEILEELNKK